MKTNKIRLAGLVALALTLVGLIGASPIRAGAPHAIGIAPSSPASLTWNLAADFRVFPNQANPNPDSYGDADTWSFMYTTAAHDPSKYRLITQFYPNAGEHPGLQGWEGPEPTGYPNSGAPEVTMNTSGIPVVQEFDLSYPPGSIEVHPDSSKPAIVGWHSPITGSVAVVGGVKDICVGLGDGILWFIDKGSSTVASGSYPNGGSQLFQAGTNGNQLGNIPVNKGDSIYFLVAPGGDYYCDGTQLDVTITMVSISKPAPPTLSSPANNATVKSASVLLDWTDIPFATRYQVVVKDAAMHTVAALTVFQESKVKVTLPIHQTYSWYIRACNSGGCSLKSAVWNFEN